MADMQTQMGAILNDPDMMQKIMAMAQSLNSSGSPPQPEPPPPAFSMPDIDPGMMQKLSGLAMHSHIDDHQKNLLQALRPYLSDHRIHKLEKAMQAAKMARLASTFLGQSGNLFGIGRE